MDAVFLAGYALFTTPTLRPHGMNMRIFILSLLFVSLSSLAIVPATRQQVLCNATHIVNGKVIAAERSPIRCGTSGIGCAPGRNPDLADLSIKVTDVMAVKDAVATVPRDVGISKGTILNVRVRAYELGDPSSTAGDVARIFTDRDFIFSIVVLFSDVWKDGKILKDYLGPPPYWAEYWSAEKQDWVKSVLSKSDGKTCPK